MSDSKLLVSIKEIIRKRIPNCSLSEIKYFSCLDNLGIRISSFKGGNVPAEIKST
jgi:hypothetical protein